MFIVTLWLDDIFIEIIFFSLNCKKWTVTIVVNKISCYRKFDETDPTKIHVYSFLKSGITSAKLLVRQYTCKSLDVKKNICNVKVSMCLHSVAILAKLKTC